MFSSYLICSLTCLTPILEEISSFLLTLSMFSVTMYAFEKYAKYIFTGPKEARVLFGWPCTLVTRLYMAISNCTEQICILCTDSRVHYYLLIRVKGHITHSQFSD